MFVKCEEVQLDCDKIVMHIVISRATIKKRGITKKDIKYIDFIYYKILTYKILTYKMKFNINSIPEKRQEKKN